MTRDPNNADSQRHAPQQGQDVPADDQLVAYLDGELDDETARTIEERLSTDAGSRDHLGRLERTWDALDDLGRAEVDETFTQTTIEMVALAAEEDQQQEELRQPARQRRKWLIAAVGLLGFGLAGFATVRAVSTNPNEQLLEDLPVLQRLEEYQQIDDIEFLELLHQEKLFEPADE